MNIRKRDILVSVLLSFVTCGIYGLYWYVVLADDVKTATKDTSLPSGGLFLLLLIVTCGIYGLYYFYKVGKALYNSKISASDNSVLYLIIAILPYPIINVCLIQNELNKTVASN